MGFARIYERAKQGFDHLLISGTLRAKAMRGGVWLGGGNVAEQATRFARNMILTRLLAPSAFGAMAIVLSSSAIIGALTEVGVRAAIIQNPRGGEEAYLNVGWWVGLGKSISMYAIIFAAAPFVAHFYGIANLSGLLRVTLLGTLFDGAMSPRSILTQKEMKFGRWAAITNGGAVCGVILTLVLSFVLRNVWALAIGYCGENVFRCLLSYILCPGLPFLGWDRHAIRDLYRFSKEAFGSSFLNLILARMDIFVLAKLYSTTTLGLYTMGVALVLTPSTFITGMLGQTLFPAFAHVQEDKERVNRILSEITSWLILLGLPCAVAIHFCGRSLLSVTYGMRYVAAAGPLSVAAAVVFLTVLNAAITCALIGVGRPALHRRAIAVSAVVMIISIYPACKLLGVVGGQVAALIANLAGYLFQVMCLRDLTRLHVLSYGKAFVPAALVSGGIFGLALGARSLGLASTPLQHIALGVGACVIAFVLCVPAFLRTRQSV